MEVLGEKGVVQPKEKEGKTDDRAMHSVQLGLGVKVQAAVFITFKKGEIILPLRNKNLVFGGFYLKTPSFVAKCSRTYNQM
jgi:hypothetical protein